jgi:O-antigen/teichoic acid export membrane protein
LVSAPQEKGTVSQTVQSALFDAGIFLLGVILIVHVGNRFGPRGLGLFALALTFYVLGIITVTSGVSAMTTAEITPMVKRDDARLRGAIVFVSLLAGLLGMFLFFFLDERIASLFSIPDLAEAISLVSVALVPGAVNSVLLSIVLVRRGAKRASQLAFYRFFWFIAVVIFLSLFNTIFLIFVSFFISEIISLFIITIGEKESLFPLTFTGSSRMIRPLISQSIRSTFAGSAWSISSRIDILLLGYFLTAKKVGIYAVALMVARFLIFIPEVIQGVLVPSFSHKRTKSEMESFLKQAVVYFKYGFLGMLILSLIIVSNYEGIIRYFFPDAQVFLESKEPFLFLLPGMVFFGTISVFEGLLISQGRSAVVGRIAFVTLFLNFFLNYFFIHAFGIAGAAVATTISLTFYFLSLGAQLKKFGLRLPRGQTIFSGIIALGVSVVLYREVGIHLVTSLLGALALFFTLIVMGYIGPDDTLFHFADLKKLAKKIAEAAERAGQGKNGE